MNCCNNNVNLPWITPEFNMILSTDVGRELIPLCGTCLCTQFLPPVRSRGREGVFRDSREAFGLRIIDRAQECCTMNIGGLFL